MGKIVAALFLILHGVDGREIRVAPDQITSLHSPKAGAKKSEKLYPDAANCLINLTDGKSVVVIEPCTTVQGTLDRREP